MTQPDKREAYDPENTWLHDLDFVDMYVSLYRDFPSYCQVIEPDAFSVITRHVPQSYQADIRQLRHELEMALEGREEASILYDGLRLRASKIVTTRGETWVALRRVADRPPLIESLGFTIPITQLLRELGRREGLVLVCGGTGQGKTTTASALLYDYLNRFGGLAFSIEDPVEYLLDGSHGESGLCYQVEAQHDDDWAKYLKRGLRWNPRYIMVGEVRTPQAANQLLRAANSGHLVITTMHAGSIEEALDGLLQLAFQAIGEMAPTLLASGLTAVMHQSFLSHSVGTRLYVTESASLGEPVRALIRERRIGQITTFVDQQEARRAHKPRG